MDSQQPVSSAPLLFNGRAMIAQPRRITLSLVVAMLSAGHTVSVRLEPGDGSGYDFVIIPMGAGGVDARALGYADDDRARGFYVINAAQHDALTACAIIIGNTDYEEAAHSLGYNFIVNKWTAELLEWWFERQLWPRMEAVMASGANAVREMQRDEAQMPYRNTDGTLSTRAVREALWDAREAKGVFDPRYTTNHSYQNVSKRDTLCELCGYPESDQVHNGSLA